MTYEIKFKKSKLIPIFEKGEVVDWNEEKVTIRGAFYGKGGLRGLTSIIEYSIKASRPTILIPEEELLKNNPWAESRKL